MPANNCTLKKNATAMTVTGGTDETFSEVGSNVANGLVAADASVFDLRIRPSITYKNRPATKQANGSWSKQKRTATIVVPKTLASGEVVFDLVRIDFEVSVETTDAEMTNLLMLSGQLPTNANLATFWKQGNVR